MNKYHELIARCNARVGLSIALNNRFEREYGGKRFKCAEMLPAYS